MKFSDLPALRLHATHAEVAGRAGIRGLTGEEVEGRIIFEPAGDDAARLAPLNDTVLRDFRLLLVGRMVVVSEICPSGSSRRRHSTILTIPLLLAELQMARSKRGEPVIVVTVSSDVNWLIVVEGDLAAAMVLMDSFAAAGGVRSDFPDVLRLSDKVLGTGASAAVHRAHSKNRSDREEDGPFSGMVAKVPLPGANVVTNGHLPDEVRHEVSMLSSVQGHPNIVRFYGAFHNRGDATEEGNSSPAWAVVMEWYPGGDLFSAVAAARFSEERSRQVMWGLMSALAHIHSRGIVHRDMKAENVLLTRQDGYPVIADFGIACHMSDEQEMTRRCGTPGYTAPEVLNSQHYGPKVDCFSTGSLLFFAICSRTPFDGPNLASILRRTVRCNVDFRVSSAFTRVSDNCKHFITSLLTKHEDDRVSAVEALEHPWLVGEGGGDQDGPPSFSDINAPQGRGPPMEAEDPCLPDNDTHAAELAEVVQSDDMEEERMLPLVPAAPFTSKKTSAPFHRFRRLAKLDQSITRGDAALNDLADTEGDKLQMENRDAPNGTISTDCPGQSFRESDSFNNRPSFRESFSRQFKKLIPRKSSKGTSSGDPSTPRSFCNPTRAPEPQQSETVVDKSETRHLRFSSLRHARAASSTLSPEEELGGVEF